MKGLQTPNLNWMANNGLKFNRFYGTNPICSPNRSALMIGVHQVKMNTHQHRSNRKYILPNGIWIKSEDVLKSNRSIVKNYLNHKLPDKYILFVGRLSIIKGPDFHRIYTHVQ